MLFKLVKLEFKSIAFLNFKKEYKVILKKYKIENSF